MREALAKIKTLIAEGDYQLMPAGQTAFDRESLNALVDVKSVLDRIYISPKEVAKKAAIARLKEVVDSVVIPRCFEHDGNKSEFIMREILQGEYLIPKIFSPALDFVFKSFLTHPDSGEIRLDFLKSYLGDIVVTARINNNEPIVLTAKGKHSIYDVSLTVVDHQDIERNVDVEMNKSIMRGDSGKVQFKHMRSRIAYTLAQLHTSQESVGVNYVDLKPSTHLNFCGFKLWENQKFMNVAKLRLEDGEGLNDDMVAITVELPKLKAILDKPVSQMTDAEKWSLFLAYADKPEHQELITKLAADKGEIRMAMDLIARISGDENERARYLSRLIADMDYADDMAASEQIGMEKGMEKGIEKGIEKGMEKFAINMIKKNFDDGTIMDVTGFGLETVKALRAEAAKG
jgi:predicted transposase/invertase (TIGR01784 family)